MKSTLAALLLVLTVALVTLGPIACGRTPRITRCLHPAIMGGQMPFTLPEGGSIGVDGQVRMTVDGADIALLGAVCITTPAPSN